jgi:hypothetical protein
MFAYFRQRLTYANVVSSLCLFILLGGGAYAATSLRRNSVGSAQLRNGSVSNPKLARNAVTGAKVKDGSLSGADVTASTLGKVPRAGNSDRLDGSGASAFQKTISTQCPNGAISTINGAGSGTCSPRIPETAVISTTTSAGGADERGVGNGVEVDVLCHYPGSGGGTKLRIANEDPAAATINWMFSDGTNVSASGTSIAGGGNSQDFDFAGKRIEGQFILARGTAVSTLNLHAVDLNSACELTGTAVGEPAYP